MVPLSEVAGGFQPLEGHTVEAELGRHLAGADPLIR